MTDRRRFSLEVLTNQTSFKPVTLSLPLLSKITEKTADRNPVITNLELSYPTVISKAVALHMLWMKHQRLEWPMIILTIGDIGLEFVAKEATKRSFVTRVILMVKGRPIDRRVARAAT
jgi:hypothetical protein